MPLFLLHIPKSEKKSVKMAEKCFYSDFYLTRNSNPGKKKIILFVNILKVHN